MVIRFNFMIVNTWLIVIVFTGNLAVGQSTPAVEITFNRDVRPILADNCFQCHGMDKNTRDGGLRLDIREEAVEFGAIEPGSPEDSELIDRINLDADDDSLMPPLKSHKHLTAQEKEILSRWIADGAQYQPHWAFIPPTRPELPSVKNTNWIRNPIDQFVLARLESAGLEHAPISDRRTLARRAALDVTGLPPSTDRLEAFIADQRPDAYERYVDGLLESPLWGEHRARYWLDYARYADTHGIHFDNFREIWAYRDWVIKSFTRNQPFDQFSIEQLAGDLLENPTLDQQIATGFNRCNITTNEGGAINDEYEVLYARERTEATSAVWLGLTTGCAVCHDHKFDPISMKEFYSLSAFFNNTTQPIMDGNIASTPPVIEVALDADRDRYQKIKTSIAELEEFQLALRKKTEKELESLAISTFEIATSLPHQEQLELHAPLHEGSGDTIQALVHRHLLPITASGPLNWNDGQTGAKAIVPVANSVLAIPGVGNFDIDDPFTAAAWVFPQRESVSGSILARLDESEKHRGWDLWMNGGRLATHFVNQWPEHAIKIIARDSLPVKQWSHVAVTHDGSGSAAGIRLYVNGIEQISPELANDSLGTETIHVDAPFTIGSRRLADPVLETRINDVRVYSVALTADELSQIHSDTLAMLAASLPMNRRNEKAAELAQWWLARNHAKYQNSANQLTQLHAEAVEIRERSTQAYVMHEKSEPATAYLLSRGEYDQRTGQVTADVPAALLPLGDLPHNRLGFAKWLFKESHPLTARVTVNRFWQEVFGTGLVRTSADFGIMGELPSHPELLDYLAVEFREHGWDVKTLFRMMLTSATYQQSARATAKAMNIDPDNRLLWHGPSFRMDAEMVRDMALWSSGLLVNQVGGPSVRPYQPPGVWEAVAMPESNTRDYQQDTGDGLYRRSMYTFWKRAAPPASLELLGAPSREECTVRRERTNTPLQALVVLNDTQFVEAARQLATMTLQQADSNDEQRLQFMAARLLSRPFAEPELTILKNGLQNLRKSYFEDAAAAAALVDVGESHTTSEFEKPELAAWTMVASELMNLDETLCK